jgi:chromate transporter
MRPDIAVATPPFPTQAQAFRVWLRIGLLSFGGPAGQIAMMHREIVQAHGWVGEKRFLHALSFCALLPGPEAQQLATYLGWLLHGPAGGAVAGTLFVLPGAGVMLALSVAYAVFGTVPAIDGLFFGLKCAVLALVMQALLRIGRRALKNQAAWMMAGAAFIALFLFRVPFPAVILAGGAIGACAAGRFAPVGHGAATEEGPDLIDVAIAADPGRPARLEAGARRAGLITLGMWLVPVVLLHVAAPGTYARVGLFFSKMAVVTVGGAYAVLAYVAQDAVTLYGWLSPADMLTGLGLAETTPGPLVLVLQFVGFMAGYHAPGTLTGLAGGLVASILTLWVTFLPCFTFVFLGAPLLERLARNRGIAAALAAITACVVGVIANLACWFALHILFGARSAILLGGMAVEIPDPDSLNIWALALAVLAGLLLFVLKQGMPTTLAICAAFGMAVRLVTSANAA